MSVVLSLVNCQSSLAATDTVRTSLTPSPVSVEVFLVSYGRKLVSSVFYYESLDNPIVMDNLEIPVFLKKNALKVIKILKLSMYFFIFTFKHV